ncbi:hypothetical protein LOAG_13187, partial [Loa loa]
YWLFETEQLSIVHDRCLTAFKTTFSIRDDRHQIPIFLLAFFPSMKGWVKSKVRSEDVGPVMPALSQDMKSKDTVVVTIVRRLRKRTTRQNNDIEEATKDP